MKKLLLLLVLVAAASSVAMLVESVRSADDMTGEADDDSMMNYLGV